MPARNLLILPLDGSVDAPAALAGGKAANLAELFRAGLPVPPAIGITARVYEQFLAAQSPEFHAALRQVAEGQPVETLMAVAEMPSRIRSVIAEAHHQLCRRLHLPESLVAVRSSGTCEDATASSFAGQFHTELNCRGESEVIAGVLRVWLSALDPRPAGYARSQGIDPRSITMPVVLQEQIHASVSGTAFTLDLESGCPMISIHSTYGLGTAVVSGEVTPDAYLLYPDSLVVLSRRLGNKTESVEYDWAGRATTRRATSTPERCAHSLPGSTLTEVAELVSRSHAYFRDRHGWQHLDLEFAVEQNGDVWLTQARPETAWSRRKTAGPLAVDREKAVKLRLILEGGSTGFPGVLTGPLRIVRSVSEAEERVRPGDILVTKATTNVWEMALAVAGGAITDVGGPSCHTAVVLREQGKPCLVGTPHATERLAVHDNKLVTLDATQRAVFLGSAPPGWLSASAGDFRPFQANADCQTKEEAWHSIPEGRTGKTFVDADGSRWILKPGKRAITPLMRSFVREDYKALLDEARETPGLRDVLSEARREDSVANLPRDFADCLGDYATRYKVTKEVDFTLSQNTALQSVVGSLLRDIGQDRQICLPQRPTASEEFFPGQDHFQRLARLCFQAAKLREDAHHQRVRGIWRFLAVVDPVIQSLVRGGQLQEREQLFEHSYRWLLERCGESSRCRRRRRSATIELALGGRSHEPLSCDSQG